MKKNILKEIENMKYLLGYKRGIVISEQDVKTIAGNIDSGNYGNLDPKVVDAIKQSLNTIGGVTGANTGTTPPTAAGTTPPAATTPVTPIKIGVKYPSIVELQTLLNTKSQAGLTPDGKYGPKTSASILSSLQNLPKTDTNATTTTTTTQPTNDTTDASSAAIKKTAETGVQGASTGAQTTGANTGGQKTGTENSGVAAGGGSGYSEIDINDLIGQPGAGTNPPTAGAPTAAGSQLKAKSFPEFKGYTPTTPNLK
jgi:hypothetical protein